MDINYDYYRIFYYVAKNKSFTDAARALMNNQPNITRMVKKLEEALGCTLFVRKHSGVALTPEGEKLYEHVSIAFEHIHSAEIEIARDRSLQSGTVTIAASEIALHCTLLPMLKKYRQTYPGVRIRVLNHTTPQAIEVLKNGLADFAMVTTPLGITGGLQVTALRRIQEVPVCSNALHIDISLPFTWKKLMNYPLISFGVQTNSYTFYSKWFSDMGMHFAPDIEASTADQILPMVKSDLGIGFVPTDFLEMDSQTDCLTVLDMEPPIPAREIVLLKREHVTLSVAAQELERMILEKTSPLDSL